MSVPHYSDNEYDSHNFIVAPDKWWKETHSISVTTSPSGEHTHGFFMYVPGLHRSHQQLPDSRNLVSPLHTIQSLFYWENNNYAEISLNEGMKFKAVQRHDIHIIALEQWVELNQFINEEVVLPDYQHQFFFGGGGGRGIIGPTSWSYFTTLQKLN